MSWSINFHARSVDAASKYIEEHAPVEMPYAVREAIFCLVDTLEDSIKPNMMLSISASGHVGPEGIMHVSVRLLPGPI